jgi:5-carboxymethyl-2-hydroxymuconic-semialdehyde dehydrogenase
VPTPFETNLAKAEGFLARFGETRLPHFIDGEHVPSVAGRSFENRTPIDNSLLGSVAAGDAQDIDRAAAAAKAAFPAWRRMAGDKRRALLHRVADAIEARGEEIALVESVDTGQAIRFMKAAAIRGAENFRFFADRAPRRATAWRCRRRSISTTRCASRSVPSASSRRGTRRSCWRPGRSRRRSPPAAPLS